MKEVRTNRPWFRFSLRTLLILLTVLCIWLGYTMNWVRQRKAILRQPHFTEFPRDDLGFTYQYSFSKDIIRDHALEETFPFSLWLVGEQRVNELHLGKVTQAEYEKMQSLFPEACISLIDEDGRRSWYHHGHVYYEDIYED